MNSAAPIESANLRATWLWNTELISSAAEREAILEFAAAEKIGRIYLQINPDITRVHYKEFIAAAMASGIQIYALGGAPQWVLPEHRSAVSSAAEWVKAYNYHAAARERFAGIQFDIEPYILPEWTTDRRRIAGYWEDTMRLFQEEAKGSDPLRTNAALPFWLDEILTADGSRTLIVRMLELLDEVTIMAYRDKAEAIIDISRQELESGDRLGKSVYLAVETNRTAEPSYITFYEEGRAEMERQLAIAEQTLRSHASFKGFAVHDYLGWRNLKA